MLLIHRHYSLVFGHRDCRGDDKQAEVRLCAIVGLEI